MDHGKKKRGAASGTSKVKKIKTLYKEIKESRLDHPQFSPPSLAETIALGVEKSHELPTGDGSKDSPLYFYVNTESPELNLGFCCLKHPDMVCPGQMRDIVEISHEGIQLDSKGAWNWKAYVPLDNDDVPVPMGIHGKVLHILKPSLSVFHRNPVDWSPSAGKDTVRSDLRAVVLSPDRHFTHYRAVFPFPIEHSIFNNPNVDFPNDAHCFQTMFDNESNAPSSLVKFSWRIGYKHQALLP